MAKPRSKSGKKKTKRRRVPLWVRRWAGWALFGVVVSIPFWVPAYRVFWWKAERNELASGLMMLCKYGCAACHRGNDGSWSWAKTPPPSLQLIADVVVNGSRGGDREMPAWGKRLTARRWRQLTLAVGAYSQLVGIPEDPELAAGYDVAVDSGCFSCHGPLGAGGIPNSGALAGRIPGWYGKSFRKALEQGNLKELIAKGSVPRALPFSSSGPAVAMPAFEGKLDSTELDLLVGYIRWLYDNPPAYRP